MKKIIILFLSIFIITGCGYNEYEMPKDAYINFNDLNIPVYSEITSASLIKDTNTKIVSKDEELKTDVIGEQTITIKYKYKKRTYKYDLTFNIVDNTPPTFIKAASYLSTTLNNVLYPCEGIVFGDDYDIHPTCSIEGYIDYTKTGDYHVEYVIQDNSGNQTRKKLTISVLYRQPSGGGSYGESEKIPFEKALKQHKNSSTMVGIDVSRYQGDVDFELVKNAGCEFVIFRMGVQNYPEDTLDFDTRFNGYYEAAKKAGLKIGVYVYNAATNAKTGKKTAEWVIENLHGEKLDLPVAYDWENWDEFMDYNINIHDLNQGYQAFKKTLEEAGYKTMLYGSYSYLESVWYTENETIWLAHYNDTTDYPGKYLLWQFTSLGDIDGITENTVDINVYYKENE